MLTNDKKRTREKEKVIYQRSLLLEIIINLQKNKNINFTHVISHTDMNDKLSIGNWNVDQLASNKIKEIINNSVKIWS